MKKTKLIAIAILMVLAVQIAMPTVYAVQNEVMEQEVEKEDESSKISAEKEDESSKTSDEKVQTEFTEKQEEKKLDTEKEGKEQGQTETSIKQEENEQVKSEEEQNVKSLNTEKEEQSVKSLNTEKEEQNVESSNTEKEKQNEKSTEDVLEQKEEILEETENEQKGKNEVVSNKNLLLLKSSEGLLKSPEPKEEITFESEKLKNYFLENYDVDEDEKITEFDMVQISELDFSNFENYGENAVDLKGIEKCTNLTSLNTSYNTFTNFGVLKDLPNLKKLVVYGTYFKSQDILAINDLTNIEELTIDNAFQEEFSIAKLPKTLKSLSLDYCNLETSSTISQFTNLEKLSINGNANGNIDTNESYKALSNIKALTKLKELKLNNIEITDIEFLQNNTTIEILDISYNNIRDISVIRTMANLKKIYVQGNQISDLNVLEELNLIDRGGYAPQNIYITGNIVKKDESLEVDTTPIIQDCYKEDSIFYVSNSYVNSNSINTEKVNGKLNSNGTKIIIDATGLEIGEYKEEFYIYGEGPLNSTHIYLTYNVVTDADNTTEIEFGSEVIKNYIKENHDIDKDGKITAFDMAQISELSIPYIADSKNENLKGLEKAVNLREFSIDINATNYKVLSELNSLRRIVIKQSINNTEDYNAITQIPNLQKVELYSVDFTKYNLYQLPAGIKELRLQNTYLNSLLGITKFENLEILELYSIQTQISNLEEISKLNNLKTLAIYYGYDKITDISFLNNNNTIENLYIDGSYVTDITPITTMTNLKNFSVWNGRIENMNLLEDRQDLLEIASSLYQSLHVENIQVYKGEKAEIELPSTLKVCFNESSKLYVENAELRYNDETTNVSLNADKTKLIIDATNLEVGNNRAYAYVEGEGKLRGTSIEIYYQVVEKGDDTKEVEFADENLKQYILNNYDLNKDGRITEFDMIQIKNLNLNSISISNSKGLEYAKNMNSLVLYIKYENDDSQVYDFSHLSQLTNLKELTVMGRTRKLNNLKDLKSLENLEINLEYDISIQQEQLKQISTLPNLKILNLVSNVKKLEPIKNMASLEYLTIDIDQSVTSLKDLENLTNLKSLKINSYAYSIDRQLDYSFLNSLTKLESLNIADSTTNSFDSNLLSKMANLKYCTLAVKELKNTNSLANNAELESINFNACKITDITFVKSLGKINTINLQNNLIADITPLKGTHAWQIDLSNNPINPEEEKNAETITLLRRNYKTLILSEYSLMDNLIFTNKKFEEYLLSSSRDLNKDGKISKYELSKIEYFYPNVVIEHAQYLINLKELNLNSVTLNIEEQEELIRQIDLLPENAKINISSFTVDLGNINKDTVQIDISKNTPLLTEIQRNGSRIYKGALALEEDYDEQDALELNNGKLIIDTSKIGEFYYALKAYNNEYSTYIRFIGKILTEGSNTQLVTIKDENLRKVILKNYDIDGDEKITQMDMLNLTTLDIYEQGIKTLEGLEKAINLRMLNACNNSISDISPIIQIAKEEGRYDFYRNEITDISCIANSKLNKTLNIGLDDNYIDFSEGSSNLKILKADYAKSEDNGSRLNSTICSQRYGKPSEKSKEVVLDANLKKKLIEYGLDTNKDGKISRLELYNTSDILSEELNLSGLGIKSIEGLEYLVYYNVNLSNNQITDVTPLGKNRKVRQLNLSNNKIKDISSFANYNKFYWGKVDLSNNQIVDISSIKTWPVMKFYEINEMYGGDIILRDIEINLSSNKISNISDVKDFIHISKLDLSNNEITDISSLANFNFKVQKEATEYWNDLEMLEDFNGIILDSNYIDLNNANNKKAIDVFSAKGVLLKLDNQYEKQIYEIFNDVAKGSWYYDSVKYTYYNNIMTGLNATTFAPNNNLTRGQMVTLLYRMEGSPEVTGAPAFPDVQDSNKYYYKAVKWAADNGIVSGYANGTFGPTDNITRAQLAVILFNYAEKKGKNVSKRANLTEFPDNSQVASWAKNAVSWAVAEGIISGNVNKQTGVKTIDPRQNATRAQVASMIERYEKNVSK